jgi:uncharacterized protein YndB with AHSA1/START domain
MQQVNPMSDYGVITESNTLRFERLLPGPIDRVWRYLIDSDKRGQWLAYGEIEPRVGGTFEHIWRNNRLTNNDSPPPEKYAQYGDESRMAGRVTAYDPPYLLAYTWGEDTPNNLCEVRYELTSRGDQVLLVLTHKQIASHDNLISFASGWHTHLNILADRLAGREPPGFWITHTRLEAEYVTRIPLSRS